eukprot:m.101155 g.101155  ORF g.101155 m.101155 type:complete len:660 (+) comp12569_c0_seq2:167-2146(+)
MFHKKRGKTRICYPDEVTQSPSRVSATTTSAHTFNNQTATDLASTFSSHIHETTATTKSSSNNMHTGVGHGDDDDNDDDDEFESELMDLVDQVDHIGANSSQQPNVSKETENNCHKRTASSSYRHNDRNGNGPMAKMSKQTPTEAPSETPAAIRGELMNVRKQKDQLVKQNTELQQQCLLLRQSHKQELENATAKWKEELQQLRTKLEFAEQSQKMLQASSRKGVRTVRKSSPAKFAKVDSLMRPSKGGQRVRSEPSVDSNSVCTKPSTTSSASKSNTSTSKSAKSTECKNKNASQSIPSRPARRSLFSSQAQSFEDYKLVSGLKKSLGDVVAFFERDDCDASNPEFIDNVLALTECVHSSPSSVSAIAHKWRKITPYDQFSVPGPSPLLFSHAHKPFRVGHQPTTFSLAGTHNSVFRKLIHSVVAINLSASALSSPPPVHFVPTLQCIRALLCHSHGDFAASSHLSEMFSPAFVSSLCGCAALFGDDNVRSLALSLYISLPQCVLRENAVLPRDIQYLAIEHNDPLMRICLAEIFQPHDVFLAFQLFEDIRALLAKSSRDSKQRHHKWSLIIRAVRSPALAAWQRFSPNPPDVVQVCFSLSVSEELVVAFKAARPLLQFPSDREKDDCANDIQTVYNKAMEHAKQLLVVKRKAESEQK